MDLSVALKSQTNDGGVSDECGEDPAPLKVAHATGGGSDGFSG